MPTSSEYMSFLVRLSRASVYGSNEPCAVSQSWHGEVEHIQTGRCWTFSTLDDLLNFLRRLGENPQILWPPAEGGDYGQTMTM